MLQQLTKYLLKFKKVSIPHVGTLVIVQHPSSLNFAERLVQPPGFKASLRQHDGLSQHQLHYLSSALGIDVQQVQQELSLLGEKLKEKIAAGGFEWNGIGHISFNDESSSISLAALQPVIAERVLRENEAHEVLVGDVSVSSHERLLPSKKRKFKFRRTTIGWIILILALLAIAFLIFIQEFSITSTGLKTRP